MGGEERVGRWICWLVLGTVPLLFGAVQAWVWSVYVALIYLAYLLYVWRVPENKKSKLGNWSIGIWGFLFFWAGLQIVPLPLAFIRMVSPLRAQWISAAHKIIGQPVTARAISVAPFNSLTKMALVVALVLFYVVLKENLKSIRQIKTFSVIIVTLGVFESFYGMIQALVPAVGVLWVDSVYAYFGMARGTYINRNHFAGYLEMVIALTLGYALAVGYWPVRGKLRRVLASDHLNKVVFWGILLVVLLIALFFSQSRAGIFCGMAGILCVFWLNRSAGRKKSSTVYILVGCMLSLFLIYGVTIGFQPIVDRFLRVGSESTSRLDIWKDGFEIVKDYPLGVGLGNFNKVYPVYHVSAPPHVRFLYAHNDYLQVLIELGWPGFLVLVGGFLVFMGTRVRRLLKLSARSGPMRFFMGAGAVGGLIAIGLHSFFDFNLQIPANAFYFVALMAVVDAVTSSQFSVDR